jgi:uncharacterized membrane protein
MRGLSPATFLSAAVSGLLLIPLAGATPAAAVELVTPYPAVAVEPGRTATFDLQIISDTREPVEVRVTEVPEDWQTVLRGDGREVEAAYATPDEPAEIQLEVRVPPDAEAGRHTVTVTGEADSGSAALPLTLTIVEQAADAFELTAGFPALQGSATDSFRFDLTLANHTAEEATFSLSAVARKAGTCRPGPRPSSRRPQSPWTVATPPGSMSRRSLRTTPPPGRTRSVCEPVARPGSWTLR